METKIKKHLKTLRTWSFVGLLLSIYATYVELKAEKDADYVALCDVSASISCTAVFTTVYGRGFGIIQHFLKADDWWWIPPNGAIGTLFYGVLLLISFRYNLLISHIALAFTLCSNLLSFYLAYLLYFVLKNLCFICVAIYIVNHQILKQTWQLFKLKKQQQQQRAQNEENEEINNETVESNDYRNATETDKKAN